MGRNRQTCRRALGPLAALVASLAAGCGGSSASSSGSQAPDYAKALESAPAPLAAIYKQTDFGRTPAFLAGGVDAASARVAKLKGHPVVLNIWGSWCGPCRQEFPYLQQAAAKFGKKVAFLGIDAADETSAARTFLQDDPVPYPSYTASDTDAKAAFNIVGFPATVIYDRAGKVAGSNIGGYASKADLFADIKRLAH